MKVFLKAMAIRFAAAATLPAWLMFVMQSAVLGRTRAFVAAGQRAARWPGVFGEYLRRALYGRLVSKMGRDVVLSFGSVLTKPTVELGDGVYIGSYCTLGDVRIGDNTLIGDHVCIPSGAGQHRFDRLDIPIRDQKGTLRTIRIGRDCWIGSGAVILADVGDHCVIGAGSVVTKPVPSFKIVVGNPARPRGDRRQWLHAAEGMILPVTRRPPTRELPAVRLHRVQR